MMIKLRFIYLISIGLYLSNFSYGQFEGKVTYEISYHSEDPSTKEFISMLPRSATLWVSGTMSRFEQALAGGGRQLFINNSKDGSSIFLMTYFAQEFMVRLSMEKLATLAQDNSYHISSTDETVQLLGYNCKKALAKADDKTFEIYFNDELSTNAYLPQFSSVKGIPFKYGLFQNGLEMKFVAKEVVQEKVADFLFTIPENIREISFDDFAKNFAVKL